MSGSGTGRKIIAAAPLAYITLTEAAEFSLRVADVAAYEAASDDLKGRALVQASDEIDQARYEGLPYDDWRLGRVGAQLRAFPRVLIDDPSQWPIGKDLVSVGYFDQDAQGEVVVPPRVKFATFLQAMEILNYPDRKARLRDRSQGVTGQSAGNVSESYDPNAPVRLICMEAMLQLAPFLKKSGRIRC
jgi:hypothetical protein